MARSELSLRERRAIEDMLNAKIPMREIAAEIGRHVSTVSRAQAVNTAPYSNDLRERVVSAMQSGGSCRSVAARFGVAPSSVVKWAASSKIGENSQPSLECA